MKKLIEYITKFLTVVIVLMSLATIVALSKLAEGYLLGIAFELREQAK